MDKLRRTLQWQIEETTPLIKVVNIRNMESSEGERTPATNGNVEIGPREDTTQPESQPDDPSHDGQQSDDGNEISRKKIGYPFDGRSLRLTVTDDLNDLIEPKSSA
jgi:hypothetical protein